jgi:hypothetical protein
MAGLGSRRPRVRGSIECGNVLGEKIIEHGANGRDHREFADVVPSRGHRRSHQIGSEREFERKQDPGREFEPDLAALNCARLALPNRGSETPKRLHGAEADDEHGAGLNDERNELRDLLELIVKRNAKSPASAAGRLESKRSRASRKSNYSSPVRN